MRLVTGYGGHQQDRAAAPLFANLIGRCLCQENSRRGVDLHHLRQVSWLITKKSP